jgi:hypothetical protein
MNSSLLQNDRSKQQAALGKILKHKVNTATRSTTLLLRMTSVSQVEKRIAEEREVSNSETEADRRAQNVRAQRQSYMDRIMAQRPHPCLEKQMIVDFHKPREGASQFVI